ncbi:ABC transporter substrate-binding protein [Pseudogracilibacillus sp. SE30717A]|uniref:ABC transporter substrate-binding protein n=1 Tax=Pseudogracilibacillus sp. SE30717A TaxID=3098293 RepID=UPI00300DC6A0
MRKYLLTLLTVLFAVFVLSACSGGSDSDTSTEGAEGEDVDMDKTYVALVSKGFQHQFWQSVKEGAEQAAEEFDVEVTFEGPEDESQVDKQMEMFRNALDRNPDAIGFAALDSQASTPLLEETVERDIPVIAFDSGVDSDIPLTTASTNNYDAAALAAEKMAELIDGKGKVAVIVHDQTSVTGVDRRDGFVETIENDFPDIEIVDIQYGGGDHLESTDLTKAIIQAHPDINGVYGANEGSAIGVVNAVRELNKAGEIVVIGFDSGQQQIDAIKEGLMAGAITQSPVGIGYETVKAAVEALEGKELPDIIDTGFYWYDADNIDDEEIQAAIYE